MLFLLYCKYVMVTNGENTEQLVAGKKITLLK